MKCFMGLDAIGDIKETVVALGNFDGVHKGHQELIRRAVNTAISTGLKSAVFTFSNHPKNVLAKKTVVKNILYLDEKKAILEDLGVNYLVSVPFDEKIQRMRAEDFIKEILIKYLKMKGAFCGYDYRFGHKGEGTPETLMKLGSSNGFGIHILEPYMVLGEIVSSTLIRNYIADGYVDKCLPMMGHYYSVRGKVVVGNKLGKSLGFPTTNIIIDEDMVTPPNGVYITLCSYNGIKYPSVTNVGVKPTIGNDYKRNMETHIFNFDKDIYGREIKVEFIEKIRWEMKFDNVEELRKQIRKDCLTAASYHGIINRQ